MYHKNISNELRKIASLMETPKTAKINFLPQHQKQIDDILKKYDLDKMVPRVYGIQKWTDKFFKVKDTLMWADSSSQAVNKMEKDILNMYGSFQGKTKVDIRKQYEEQLDELDYWVNDQNDEKEGFKTFLNWIRSTNEELDLLEEEIPKFQKKLKDAMKEMQKLL